MKDNNFNDGYIEASQEAYDLLVESGYKDGLINKDWRLATKEEVNSLHYVGKD